MLYNRFPRFVFIMLDRWTNCEGDGVYTWAYISDLSTVYKVHGTHHQQLDCCCFSLFFLEQISRENLWSCSSASSSTCYIISFFLLPPAYECMGLLLSSRSPIRSAVKLSCKRITSDTFCCPGENDSRQQTTARTKQTKASSSSSFCPLRFPEIVYICLPRTFTFAIFSLWFCH